MLTDNDRFKIKAGAKHKDADRYREGVAIDAKPRMTGWAGDKLSGYDVFTADFSKGGVYEWKDFVPVNENIKTESDAEQDWIKRAVESKQLFVSLDRTYWD